MLEATRDEAWTTLQLVIRHRRDLVGKGAALNCQIRDHLEAALPGYAACFDKLWESAVPWHLLRHYPTAEQLRAAGVTTLGHSLRQAGIRFQQRTVQAVLDWAARAAPGDVAASQHQRIALALYDDRLRKTQEIQALEREIAGRLAQTPYVLLLSFPGINVVSAADFAGEMGPIEHYANDDQRAERDADVHGLLRADGGVHDHAVSGGHAGSGDHGVGYADFECGLAEQPVGGGAGCGDCQ